MAAKSATVLLFTTLLLLVLPCLTFLPSSPGRPLLPLLAALLPSFPLEFHGQAPAFSNFSSFSFSSPADALSGPHLLDTPRVSAYPSSSSPSSCVRSSSSSPSSSSFTWSPSFFVFPHFIYAAGAADATAGQRSVATSVPPVAVAGAGTDALPTFESLLEAASADDFFLWLRNVRRQLHSWPELMFQEKKTSALVQLALEALNIPFTKGWGSDTLDLPEEEAEKVRAEKKGTGVVAHVGTGKEPCIVLRADMDALPILEKTNVPFKSKVDNVMHACGHDVHTTMLLGAAALLKAVEPQLKGTVRLIFQPAEEGGAGGLCMRNEGVLKMYPPARLVFGHHVEPLLPTGVVGTKPGAFMAATTSFTIKMEGKGGHAAAPFLGIDAGPAVAAFMQAVYSIGSREVYFDERHAGLISVTQVHGGTAINVIPPAYTIVGTIRALTTDTQKRLERRVQDAAEYSAAAFRCTAYVEFDSRRYPPTINDPRATQLYSEMMGITSKSGKVEEIPFRMGGEDFSFFLQEVPGTFAVIGVGSGAEIKDHPRTDFPLHSDYFAVDERVLSRGAALEAYLALRVLAHISVEEEKDKREEKKEIEEGSKDADRAAAAAKAARDGKGAAAAAAANGRVKGGENEEERRRIGTGRGAGEGGIEKKRPHAAGAVAAAVEQEDEGGGETREEGEGATATAEHRRRRRRDAATTAGDARGEEF